MTQHEMHCIASNIPLDSRLIYAVTLSHPQAIGTFKYYLQASCEDALRSIVSFAYPGFTLVRSELL